MVRYAAEIVEVRQETPLDRSFALRVLDAPEGAFAYVPGQFVVVADPQAEKPVRRAYSMSSAPSEGELLCVTVRDMGRFGSEFYGFPAGTRLELEPPRGAFTLPAEPAELVLVAGGSGVTPFRSYVVELAAAGSSGRVSLFQSAQQPDQLVFRSLFEDLAGAHAWFRYRPTVTRLAEGDPWKGERGRIDEARIRAELREPTSAWFHACGPGVFVKSMFALADAIGIPPARRRKEQWG